MISKMSKYAFMVYHKEYNSFLSQLRDLGVVHIQELRSTYENTELQLILSQRKRINQVMRDMKKLNSQEKDVQLAPARAVTKEEGLGLLKTIEELQERKLQLQTSKAALDKEIDYMQIWGNFNYTHLSRLKPAGYKVTFFSCPNSKFDPAWIDEYNVIEINNVQSVSYFITITPKDVVIDIDAERPKMPEMGLDELQASYAQKEEQVEAINRELKARAVSDYNTLQALDNQLQDEYNLSNVMIQTEAQADDKLMLLEGWTPVENAPALEAALDAEGFYFQPLEIAEDDKVPIQLKNNKFSQLYEPITKMFALPKYTEFDPTPFFAPFFMLFFGLCFGDGGYGLIMFLVCTYFKMKVPAEYKPFLSLFQLFGLSAVVVGTLTGSIFGVDLATVPALVKVKDYFISSDNLMTISIVLGLVQIIFGKVVAALQTHSQKGFKYSLASFGWVFTILALVCAFGLPALDVHLPDMVITIMYAIAGVGLLVALFYNSPGKNIFVNLGSGLWAAYNNASGLLGDTLSYIRLFAIGLTGGILGGVFNSLAIDLTDGLHIIPKAICMTLILVFGHSLNFALCTISSLVHPLRLTFVEYYKNAEFEGGGKEYTPFKKA
ncbi:MAG: ATPase [Tannerellaceae bacterium]|nr:ATPase [Tannerellaceae bacterium]MCD8264302.1 ATPase [Tannerellaceae bacterium]